MIVKKLIKAVKAVKKTAELQSDIETLLKAKKELDILLEESRRLEYKNKHLNYDLKRSLLRMDMLNKELTDQNCDLLLKNEDIQGKLNIAMTAFNDIIGLATDALVGKLPLDAFLVKANNEVIMAKEIITGKRNDK